jgi:hypothetical protein
MEEHQPSPRIIQQRIRNRIFEYLEMVVEFESDHPPWDLNELVNQWEDWVRRPCSVDTWPPPTYTCEEVAILMKMDSAWDSFCEATPGNIVDESAALRNPAWSNLVCAAAAALNELRKRGKLSEEQLADDSA